MNFSWRNVKLKLTAYLNYSLAGAASKKQACLFKIKKTGRFIMIIKTNISENRNYCLVKYSRCWADFI
jgi:hypothetical protein